MRLILLMLAPFAFSTGAYVFSGLLEPMSRDLGVPIGAVGQLQAAFALSVAVGGPLLARLTGHWNRKRFLIGVMILLTLANAVSALAETFPVLIAARIAAGFIGALTLPLASTIAVMLVGEAARPRALATVFAGTALSLLIGIPMGSVVGASFGWPASFWLASALCGAVALLTALFIPATGKAPPQPAEGFRGVLRWPLTGLMGVTFLTFAATFSTVAFVGPVTTAITGFTGAHIGMMQTLVGIGALGGLVLGARLAASSRSGVLSRMLLVIVATQVLYTLAMLIDFGAVAPYVQALAILPGAGALFAISPIIQSRLAGAAGAAATLAFALNGSMIFFGQGIGAILGGLTVETAGLAWVGLTGAAVACAGAVLAGRVRSEG